jgi:hypothetical protein
VQFMVMILFRHIYLSSGLIDKDVKIRQKFHEPQLFVLSFLIIQPLCFSYLGTPAKTRSAEKAAPKEISFPPAIASVRIPVTVLRAMVSFLAPLC